MRLSIAMQSEAKERWLELCERAAVEQDPVKLFKLIQEINRLLDEKEERLVRFRRSKEASNPSKQD